ncbi:MAG: T9SS type A sorting domain-containing protein [Muribaculaceae bacterium]|nr:T9SS type A sorting domain-containing protein [Muribaculaceae bacterium]
MKKFIYISLMCASLAIASAGAAPWPSGAQRIDNVQSTGASVRGGDGHIYLTAGNEDAVFQIYSITGQMVKQLKVNAESHASVEMPKGFYIVKYNNQWSRKVVVN